MLLPGVSKVTTFTMAERSDTDAKVTIVSESLNFNDFFNCDAVVKRGKEEFKLSGTELLQYVEEQEAKASARFERHLKIIETRQATQVELEQREQAAKAELQKQDQELKYQL